jgi:hypothetical protein
MKNYLIVIILALIFTCWLTDTGTPPKPQPVAIGEMKEKTLGMERKDQDYGDFNYVDQPAAKLYLTKIGDKGSNRKLDFPWAAGN